jgi:hypothetical protein
MRLIAVLTAVGIVFTQNLQATYVPVAHTTSPAQALTGIVEDVAAATGKRYQTRDNTGASMDGLKIVDNPRGGYLGVYHTTEAHRVHASRVATSPDMFTWTRRAVISPRASMPTIKVLSDGSVLIAEEADNNSSSTSSRTWLRVKHYPSVTALLSGRASRSIDLPHTLAPYVGAEGTPDIRTVRLRGSIDRSTIVLGFHYLRKTDKVDRQARGVLTNLHSWRTQRLPERDAPIERLGVRGNIGDRDTVVLGGQRLALVEGQGTVGSFGTWDTYLYEDVHHTARRLNIRTNAGSTAFANPSISLVRAPSGAPAVVVTLFIPQEGAVGGESGELVYYRVIGPRIAGAA